MAVFVEPILQRFNPLNQICVLLLQLDKERIK
jgi:hypothetical protein